MKKMFQAKIDEIRPTQHWIMEQIEAVGFSSKELKQIELASEEVMVNTISHGLKGVGEIELEVNLYQFGVEITFSDTGPPFNPLKREDFNPDLELEERQIGGLGIHFIRECMDEIEYERQENQNLLKLKKTTYSSRKK